MDGTESRQGEEVERFGEEAGEEAGWDTVAAKRRTGVVEARQFHGGRGRGHSGIVDRGQASGTARGIRQYQAEVAQEGDGWSEPEDEVSGDGDRVRATYRSREGVVDDPDEPSGEVVEQTQGGVAAHRHRMHVSQVDRLRMVITGRDQFAMECVLCGELLEWVAEKTWWTCPCDIEVVPDEARQVMEIARGVLDGWIENLGGRRLRRRSFWIWAKGLVTRRRALPPQT